MTKIGIVASGGGNHCGATAGAFHALHEVHGISRPHVIVTTSGGTQPALYYMARRFKEYYEWPRLFADPRYVNRLRFWRMLDIEVLFDDILYRQVPGLYEEAGRSEIDIFVATTRAATGETYWLTRKHFAYGTKVKKATAAVPGVYGRTVEIDGEELIDGCFSASLADCVAKARAAGAEKVIVIDTEDETFSLGAQWALRVLSYHQGTSVRRIVRQYLTRQRIRVGLGEDLVLCRPKLHTRHALDTNAHRTALAIREGYTTMAALKM